MVRFCGASVAIVDSEPNCIKSDPSPSSAKTRRLGCASATPSALGVALAQPKRRVFALEGDGSLLMQLGSLSTIATLAPQNLTMIVMDNGVYQITGAQPTPAAAVSDIVAIAAASGLAG